MTARGGVCWRINSATSKSSLLNNPTFSTGDSARTTSSVPDSVKATSNATAAAFSTAERCANSAASAAATNTHETNDQYTSTLMLSQSHGASFTTFGTMN